MCKELKSERTNVVTHYSEKIHSIEFDKFMMWNTFRYYYDHGLLFSPNDSGASMKSQ